MSYLKPILSRHGLYRGFVVGTGGLCQSHDCFGSYLHVDWEFGYQMRLCTTGIIELITHYRIFDGGEIDARWVHQVDPPDSGAPLLYRPDVSKVNWLDVHTEALTKGFASDFM